MTPSNEVQLPFIVPGAEDLFAQFDREELFQSKNTCIGLDRDLRMVLLNPAYYNFARANNGSHILDQFGLGAPLLDAIEGGQRQFYEDLLRGAMAAQSVKHFDYECSSPTEYRVFRMIIYPVADGRGLLTEHAVSTIAPHDRPGATFDPGAYVDSDGIVHLCGHCRRVRHLTHDRWDWCPEAMNHQDLTHGLCNLCLDFYHPAR
ncbi:hypothetical protein GF377_07255 [candidate division GN15 bacterium]|nr:hypothetical protein [candidate division GN15 bacterium]